MSALFIKVCTSMPNHPKIADLSDRAFRDLVTIWCYCSEHLTDGHLQPRRYAAMTTPDTAQELLDAGLVEASGDGYDVHDYLEHQWSKDRIEARRTMRAEQGRIGGLRSAAARQSSNGSSRSFSNSLTKTSSRSSSKSSSKIQPDKDRDKDKDREVLRTSQDARPRAKTTPIPDDWQPTPGHATYATEHHLDLNSEAFKFRNHAIANDRRQARWDATFTTWLAKARDYATPKPTATRKPGLPEGW